MTTETATPTWAPQPILVGPAEQKQPLRQNGQSHSTTGPNAPVSILVPCCGQLEHTQLSAPRLLRHSRPPFELIFLDIGSLDGTADYLAGIAAAAPVRVEVVRAAEADFAAAVQEGVARARGTYLAWVSPDVLVPALWLRQLTGLAACNPAIGMVGPMANVAPGRQRLTVPYRLRRGGMDASEGDGPLDTTAVDRFAEEHRQKHMSEWFEAERLGGFCFLLKREVLEQAPLIDGRAETGVFDADALSAAVRRAGLQLACCADLFVHHFGSRVGAA